MSREKERSHASPSRNERKQSPSRSRSRDKEPKKKRSEKGYKNQKEERKEKGEDRREKEDKRERSDKPLWGPKASGQSGAELADMKEAGKTGRSRPGGTKRKRSESSISEGEKNRLVAGQRGAEI